MLCLVMILPLRTIRSRKSILLGFPVSFPLIARDKENGISSGKAVRVQVRQVVRSRKHRKQQ